MSRAFKLKAEISALREENKALKEKCRTKNKLLELLAYDVEVFACFECPSYDLTAKKCVSQGRCDIRRDLEKVNRELNRTGYTALNSRSSNATD